MRHRAQAQEVHRTMGRKFKLSQRGGIRKGTAKLGTGDKKYAADRDANAAERKRLAEAAEPEVAAHNVGSAVQNCPVKGRSVTTSAGSLV